jgi:glycerol-3-phosphate acyltransferase PlsY
VFSFWIGFRGGKGVATSAGVFAALTPAATLIALGVWLGVVSTTGYVSLGSILGAVALATSTLLIPHPGGGSVAVFTSVLAAFIIWAHRGNITRLIRGKERRFGKRRQP